MGEPSRNVTRGIDTRPRPEAWSVQSSKEQMIPRTQNGSSNAYIYSSNVTNNNKTNSNRVLPAYDCQLMTKTLLILLFFFGGAILGGAILGALFFSGVCRWNINRDY